VAFVNDNIQISPPKVCCVIKSVKCVPDTGIQRMSENIDAAVRLSNRDSKQKKLMKKHILLIAAIILLSINNISAQKKVTVDYAVTTSFNHNFKGASLLQWTKLKNSLFMARFENHGDHCIAYFTPDGRLLLTGRKISFEITPLVVRKRTEELCTMHSTKSGELTIREIYELAGDHGTEYFINLTGKKLALSVIIYGDGTSKVLKESNLPSGNEGTSVLAVSGY
jgi:hypothetical protein